MIPFVADHTGQVKGLITWRNFHLEEYPGLELLYLQPNIGTKKRIYIPRLLADSGFRRGVADLFLPLARCGYSGLYIITAARCDRNQGDCEKFQRGVEANGFYWHVMRTWLKTKDLLIRYHENDESFKELEASLAEINHSTRQSLNGAK